MVYPFQLPTTGNLSFAISLTSSTHPSLPTAATSQRSLVRDTLKRHKRLPAAQQPQNLQTVLNALNAYLPYLFALDAGLSNGSVGGAGGEEVDVVLMREVEGFWRATLSSRPVGREAQRLKVKSLEGELGFVLSSLGYTYSLLARAQLRPLYERAGTPLAEEMRKKAVAAAMVYLLQAQAVHNYLLQRASSHAHAAQYDTTKGSHIADITPSVYSALASMALAEATLITVLKDDPYPSAVADERNPNNKDWMFKGVEMPRVRAHLFARLCLAAGEHAGRGLAAARNNRGVDERLIAYLEDLRATARAKAMRFLGVDAEASGKTGEGIAWIRAARRELGFLDDDSKSKGLSKLKNSWREKREDRKVEKGDAEWGSDAGRFEEGRVLEMLRIKWEKLNDTVSVQIVPSSDPLVANMPSGREYHQPKPFVPPCLDEDILAQMRAPPEANDLKVYGEEADSADDSDAETIAVEPPGAFPGTKADYASNSAYY